MGFCWNSGMVCSATGRLLVQEGIAPEFTRRLLKALAQLKQGPSFEEGVDIGPSQNRMQYEKARAAAARADERGTMVHLVAAPHPPTSVHIVLLAHSPLCRRSRSSSR
jgi:acyl-CoA reductase-like NAD-dependent aldehyde dehydrogenase